RGDHEGQPAQTAAPSPAFEPVREKTSSKTAALTPEARFAAPPPADGRGDRAEPSRVPGASGGDKRSLHRESPRRRDTRPAACRAGAKPVEGRRRTREGRRGPASPAGARNRRGPRAPARRRTP